MKSKVKQASSNSVYIIDAYCQLSAQGHLRASVKLVTFMNCQPQKYCTTATNVYSIQLEFG